MQSLHHCRFTDSSPILPHATNDRLAPVISGPPAPAWPNGDDPNPKHTSAPAQSADALRRPSHPIAPPKTAPPATAGRTAETPCYRTPLDPRTGEYAPTRPAALRALRLCQGVSARTPAAYLHENFAATPPQTSGSWQVRVQVDWTLTSPNLQLRAPAPDADRARRQLTTPGNR